MLKKYAVRFILNGKSRTYVLNDVGSVDAICTALDKLEADVPGIAMTHGLAVIAKAYPEGASLADEGVGPLIDCTRTPLEIVGGKIDELVAA